MGKKRSHANASTSPTGGSSGDLRAPSKRLSEVALARLDASDLRVKLAHASVREKKLEDRYDESVIASERATMQVKYHEMTIGRMIRKQGYDQDIARLEKELATVGERHEALKVEIGIAHEVPDWNAVSYDDETGIITLLNDPVSGETPHG